MKQQIISIIIPMYNEGGNARPVYEAVKEALRDVKYDFEMIFVDDGSKDNTAEQLKILANEDPRVRQVELARNFGKEIALSAGLHNAEGQAAIMLDADLQHPPSLIPKFIEKWEEGADLVIGVRKDYKVGWFKRQASKLFYTFINKVSETDLVPHATDFRLVDRQVIDAFNLFTERNRITRGLFDWLGYKRTLIYFETAERHSGQATYDLRKLVKLAMDSLVGHSLFPLRLAGYIGVLIICVSIPMFLVVSVDRYIFNQSMHISGSVIVAIINLLLSGITLSTLGLISLYLANMHTEVTNRPLYVKRPEARTPKRRSLESIQSAEDVAPVRGRRLQEGVSS